MSKHIVTFCEHLLASDCASTQRRGRKGPCPGTSMYDKFYATCYYDELQEAYPPMVRNGTGKEIPDLQDMEVHTDARVLSPSHTHLRACSTRTPIFATGSTPAFELHSPTRPSPHLQKLTTPGLLCLLCVMLPKPI